MSNGRILDFGCGMCRESWNPAESFWGIPTQFQAQIQLKIRTSIDFECEIELVQLIKVRSLVKVEIRKNLVTIHQLCES